MQPCKGYTQQMAPTVQQQMTCLYETHNERHDMCSRANYKLQVTGHGGKGITCHMMLIVTLIDLTKRTIIPFIALIPEQLVNT
jgi:hypothetical protein